MSILRINNVEIGDTLEHCRIKVPVNVVHKGESYVTVERFDGTPLVLNEENLEIYTKVEKTYTFTKDRLETVYMTTVNLERFLRVLGVDK